MYMYVIVYIQLLFNLSVFLLLLIKWQVVDF